MEEKFKIENSNDYSIEFLTTVLREAKEHLTGADLIYDLNKKRINTIYQIIIPSIAGIVYLLKDENKIPMIIFLSISLSISIGLLWWNTKINKYIEASMHGFQPEKISWSSYKEIKKDEQEREIIVRTIELYQSKLSKNLLANNEITSKITCITKVFIWISTIQIISFVVFKWISLC